MAGKVLLVVGMGPQIGMSLARRFGREGYRVGMIARNRDKLELYARELRSAAVEATGAVADVMDRAALTDAIQSLQGRLGPVDVLEYSPLLNMYGLVDVLKLDARAAQEQFEFQVLGAITAAQAVLPDMIARGDGALLFTTGASAYMPAPSHANGSLGVVALRHYAVTLHTALASRGVYAGTVSIARKHTGDEIAELYWDMVQKRDRCESLLGDPRLMAAYEELVAGGLGQVYPPAFKGALPSPQTERERSLQLVSLYHVMTNMQDRGAGGTELERLKGLVADRRGDLRAPFYGADLDAIYAFPPLR